MLTRRDLLRSGLGAAALTFVRPGVFARFEAAHSTDRTLVWIELTGGNDGLNTVVPFADDLYRRARPALAFRAEQVHRLDESTALAPSLRRTAALFKDGLLRIERGVGMPAPDRSHFESLDRWHTGGVRPDGRSEGWLGRALNGPQPHAAFAAAALGDRAMPRVLSGTSGACVACESLSDLVPSEATRRALRDPKYVALCDAWGDGADRARDAAARTLAEAFASAVGPNAGDVGIPESDLGRKLRDAYRLATGPLRARAVFVKTGGFDTHARQDLVHPGLLADLDGALDGFVRALKKAGALDRTLVLVTSEFGRRVRENGGRGTDHGSGGPAFLAGGALAAGLFGARPDLADLDQGDVRATTDFRRLLATALRHIGHARPSDILGAEGVPL